jgi:hypothetical protein
MAEDVAEEFLHSSRFLGSVAGCAVLAVIFSNNLILNAVRLPSNATLFFFIEHLGCFYGFFRQNTYHLGGNSKFPAEKAGGNKIIGQ